jgi:hypothetical protein
MVHEARWWLHMAFGIGVEVERYVDRAHGVLAGLPSSDCWISEVILHPKIALKAGYEMTAATMAWVTRCAQDRPPVPTLPAPRLC